MRVIMTFRCTQVQKRRQSVPRDATQVIGLKAGQMMRRMMASVPRGACLLLNRCAYDGLRFTFLLLLLLLLSLMRVARRTTTEILYRRRRNARGAAELYGRRRRWFTTCGIVVSDWRRERLSRDELQRRNVEPCWQRPSERPWHAQRVRGEFKFGLVCD